MLIPVDQPAPTLTLEEVKQHLREDGDEQDAIIEGLILAAAAHIGGADGWLGRALGVQTFDWKPDGAPVRDRWCRAAPYGWPLRLPLPPLVEVVSVTYRDPDGASQVFDPSNYTVHGVGASLPGFITLNRGVSLPALHEDPGALTIRFRAGYQVLPAPIRAAMLLMIGDWYESRQTAIFGATTSAIPMVAGVQALLSPYRVFA